jgi:histone-lysine N-methyltransferase SETD1
VKNAKASPTNQAVLPVNGKVEKSWQYLTFTKKNRTVPAKKAPSPKPLPRPRRSASISTESSEDEIPLSRKRTRSISSLSDRSEREIIVSRTKRILDSPISDEEVKAVVIEVQPTAPEVVVVEEAVKFGKVVKAKVVKGKKGAKKARITTPVVELEAPMLDDSEVTEIKLDDIPTKVLEEVQAKPAKKRGPAGNLEKFVNTAVLDEEDAYWLGRALTAQKDEYEPVISEDEDVIPFDDKHPLYHTSGSSRAEGWKKIPQIAKSAYLPQRNRAAVSVDDAAASTSIAANPGHTSGRTARVTGRRLALDMESHRKTAASATAESDLFAFNQLRIRKKALRFARSAIEGYGLYAMESINIGEMVCEYVGEVCRSAVAEVREQRYLKQGIGSSYLFRLDGDMVCDATMRGSVRWVWS